MGTGRSMSRLISSTHRSWSSVSVYSNCSSNSRCQGESGEKAKPGCRCRWA